MKRSIPFPLLAIIALAVMLVSCSDDSTSPNTPVEPGPLYENASFPIGVAVPIADWESGSIRTDAHSRAIVEKYFNSVTPENVMKFEYLQPAPGVYNWTDTDWLQHFALSLGDHGNGKMVHGHTLVWHNQLPAWVQTYPGSIDSLRTAYITKVVQRYSFARSWDVVNEAFEDDGTMRYTIWYENNNDYIAQSFIDARAADADAELYYNDYNLAVYPDKLDAVIAMAKTLLARDVPIDGIGFQMHVLDGYPDAEMITAALQKAVATGLKIRISELDVSVNFLQQYTEFSDELAEKQRARYREIVSMYKSAVPESQQGGITVWGVTDRFTWLRAERQEWPLLFDENYRPKPAFYGFEEGLKEGG